MTKKKGKLVEKVEEPTIEPEQQVTSVNEVIPEAPAEETEKTTPTDEKSVVESVVSDVVEGMVTAKVIMGDIRFIDFVDGDIKHYKKGEVFTTTKERMDSLDQRFIKIV